MIANDYSSFNYIDDNSFIHNIAENEKDFEYQICNETWWKIYIRLLF